MIVASAPLRVTSFHRSLARNPPYEARDIGAEEIIAGHLSVILVCAALAPARLEGDDMRLAGHWRGPRDTQRRVERRQRAGSIEVDVAAAIAEQVLGTDGRRA